MLKCVLWTSIPTHHQRHFLDALRRSGVDLQVRYYRTVGPERRALGWSTPESLPPGEQYVDPAPSALDTLQDWRGHVHVIPGYGNRFLRRLCVAVSKERVSWVHWSEWARPGLRWLATYPVKRWYARMVNEYALGAFGTGHTAVRDFRRWGIHVQRVAALPYAPPAADSRAMPDPVCAEFRSGRRAFLYLGSLSGNKGTDLLLRSFSRIASRDSRWVLLLVGNDQSKSQFKRLAKKLGIEQRVLFRGAVPAAEVSGVLKTADVLVLPSRYDGWGAVLNEGASMGLALVASDNAGAAWHLIDPGENGFRVRAGSASSLAEAMKAYVSNPRLAETHGAHSQELFTAYTPERNARRFVNSIQSWLAMGATRRRSEGDVRDVSRSLPARAEIRGEAA